MRLPRIGTEMSLTERAYEALKEAILEKHLAPNETFFELEVARQLGVSRTPLRAALQKLQYEHLVESLPGKGYRVASLNRDDMEHVFFMRELLEPAAARLAAENRTPEEAELLLELVDEQERQIELGEYLEYLHFDRDFHLGIAAASRNPYLESNCTMTQMHGYRFLVLDELIRNRTRTSPEEHRGIAVSIKNGDGARAERLVRAHVASTREMLCRQL